MDLVNLGQVVALGREVKEVPIFQGNLGLGFKGFTPVAGLRAWPHKLVYGCRLTSRGAKRWRGGKSRLALSAQTFMSNVVVAVFCARYLTGPWHLLMTRFFSLGWSGKSTLIMGPMDVLWCCIPIFWFLHYDQFWLSFGCYGTCLLGHVDWQCGTSQLGNGWWTRTWPGGDDPAQVCFECGAHLGEILGCWWWSVWCRCFSLLGFLDVGCSTAMDLRRWWN